MKQFESKKYKALMLDVDGTLILNTYTESLPTKKVKEAVKKASKTIHVGLATSRPPTFIQNILDELELSSPCILTGGAQIYDPIEKRILFTKEIKNSDIKKIFKIVNKYNLIVLDDGRGGKAKLLEKDIIYKSQFWVEIEDQKTVETVYAELSEIPTISVHKVISRYDGEIEILIGHTQATKQFGILKVAEILGIDTHEIIGVGDGYNDFPLLMACGLKVAMGNAVPELKEIADYVAPPVEEDGVADVIERFVLNEKSN